MIGTRLPRSSLHPFPESTRISTCYVAHQHFAFWSVLLIRKVTGVTKQYHSSQSSLFITTTIDRPRPHSLPTDPIIHILLIRDMVETLAMLAKRSPPLTFRADEGYPETRSDQCDILSTMGTEKSQ